MNLGDRARAHAALGDERRLAIVDHLALGDRTVAELSDFSAMRGNLLAHHLDVLEGAGIIERRVSEGDHRRRYISLKWDRLPSGLRTPRHRFRDVAFVCTHNSARSQFAAALYEQSTGRPASSAGSDPASSVNPKAVQVASEFGIDLSSATPKGYDSLGSKLDLVVSVCDRALEGGLPASNSLAHWSVADPVARGTVPAFRVAFGEIAERMGHITEDDR